MSLPGRESPGLRSPGAAHPGAQSPGYAEVETPSATGVATDATGTTTVGQVSGDRNVTLNVNVDAGVSDFEFQVTVAGETVFDSAQAMSQTGGEDFTPSGGRVVTRVAGDADVVYEVTTAGSAGTADVTVTTASEERV